MNLKRFCNVILFGLLLAMVPGISMRAEEETESVLEETESTMEYEEFDSSILAGIASFKEEMNTVCTDTYMDFQIFRYSEEDQSNSILRSFSVYSPNVSADEVALDLEDLTSSANWAIFSEYEFQEGRLDNYSDAQPIDVNKLEDFFGEAWKEAEGFDFASGYSVMEDGGRYYWVPICYLNEDGSIYNDEVYLYVYAVWDGADEEYLSEQAFYAVYNEYRTEKLIIADQQIAAQLLAELRDTSDTFVDNDASIEYEELSVDSSGDAVRAMQTALVEQGYMTSSADGYFGPLTEEAVMAYQEANGMEVTGVASVEMQRMLLSTAGEKSMLLDWIQMQLS